MAEVVDLFNIVAAIASIFGLIIAMIAVRTSEAGAIAILFAWTLLKVLVAIYVGSVSAQILVALTPVLIFIYPIPTFFWLIKYTNERPRLVTGLVALGAATIEILFGAWFADYLPTLAAVL